MSEWKDEYYSAIKSEDGYYFDKLDIAVWFRWYWLAKIVARIWFKINR